MFKGVAEQLATGPLYDQAVENMKNRSFLPVGGVRSVIRQLSAEPTMHRGDKVYVIG